MAIGSPKEWYAKLKPVIILMKAESQMQAKVEEDRLILIFKPVIYVDATILKKLYAVISKLGIALTFESHATFVTLTIMAEETAEADTGAKV